MVDVIAVIGIGIIAIITILVMWYNEAVMRYDLAFKELEEALQEAEEKYQDSIVVLREVKHVVVNDSDADYKTKAKVYALMKKLE